MDILGRKKNTNPCHFFSLDKYSVKESVSAASVDVRLHYQITCSLEMISSLVMLTMSMSSTANAGYEMMERTPASTSLDVEALGSMELRIDC